MCGGKAPQQRASAHEIALAMQAGRRDQRFEHAYMPLETFEIEQFRDPKIQQINRDVLAGRVNADVAFSEMQNMRAAMQAAQASGTGLTSSNNAEAFTQQQMSVGQGLSAGRTEADRMARQIRDGEGMAIARTGQNMARGNTEGLAGMARLENYKASSRVQDQLTVNSARAQALGDIASVAVIGGMDAWKRSNPAKELEPGQKLSPAANMMRGLRQKSAFRNTPFHQATSPHQAFDHRQA
jgi:hypothetical protein